MNRAIVGLIVSVALLFAIGLLMVFNTTAAEVIDRSLEGSTHSALFKQIAYSFIGVGCGSFLYRFGYENLLRYSYVFLGAATLLLCLVYLPGMGMKINGARRWIALFGYPLGQPSELIKIFLPSSYIHWFLQQEKPISWRSFCKMLCFFCLPIGLIFAEPDNGTVFILFLLAIMLFALCRIRALYWALPLFLLSLMAAAVAYQMPHVKNRIEVYLHPELDLRGKGHQPHQAKIAAGSGGLFGRGLGESLQKLNYLPEARSDYIAAIYAEEMGFVGILALLFLYLILAACGFFIAMNAVDKGAFLLAATFSFSISIQAFLNLGVVSGLLPSKGMTLPFFSQGGSSLMVNLICLFVLLDIARKSPCH